MKLTWGVGHDGSGIPFIKGALGLPWRSNGEDSALHQGAVSVCRQHFSWDHTGDKSNYGLLDLPAPIPLN